MCSHHIVLKWPPSSWSPNLLRVGPLESKYSSLSCFKQRTKNISEVRFRCSSQVHLSSVLVTVLTGLMSKDASLRHLVAHPAQDKSLFFHPCSPGMLCKPWHSPMEPARCWDVRGSGSSRPSIPRPTRTQSIHLQHPTKQPVCMPHKTCRLGIAKLPFFKS